MYIYRNIYKQILMYVFIYILVLVYVYTHTHTHICIYICIYIYVCVCVCFNVCVCRSYCHFFKVFHVYVSQFFKGHHSFIKFDISRKTLSSSVMLFPRSLGVSGLSTSYTFTKVTQLVLISHQIVVRNLNAAKKFPKRSMRLYTI